MKDIQLEKILLNNFKNNIQATFEEDSDIKNIHKLLKQHILSPDAFKVITYQQKSIGAYVQYSQIYPFTKRGIEELEKSIYIKFRESLFFIIVRDIFLLFSFVVSIYYVIKQL